MAILLRLQGEENVQDRSALGFRLRITRGDVTSWTGKKNLKSAEAPESRENSAGSARLPARPRYTVVISQGEARGAGRGLGSACQGGGAGVGQRAGRTERAVAAAREGFVRPLLTR